MVDLVLVIVACLLLALCNFICVICGACWCAGFRFVAFVWECVWWTVALR